MKRKIGIVGVPQDVGASKRGVDLGPGALRVAGMISRLKELGHDIKDFGTIDCYTVDQFPDEALSAGPMKYLDIILDTCRLLKERVEGIVDAGYFPLILGGDHSISMGSLAGIMRIHQGATGCIWVDAHGDFNTHETSCSGNIHGMPFAAVTGRGHDSLLELGPFPAVREENCVLIAARDLDRAEEELLAASKVTVFTMDDIIEQGIKGIVDEAVTIASAGVEHFHLSLDIDSLDPREMPGTGTQVSGGLLFREAMLIMKMISRSEKFSSMDLVEVNPALDMFNRTAEKAVDLLCACFGRA